jgi:hypothetical protein
MVRLTHLERLDVRSLRVQVLRTIHLAFHLVQKVVEKCGNFQLFCARSVTIWIWDHANPEEKRHAVSLALLRVCVCVCVCV